MLALVLAPAAIIGAFGLHRYRTALEAQAREAVLTTIDDLSQVADQEISDVEDQLDVVASILARPDLDASQRLAEAGTMLSASLSLGVVAIYDHTGQRIGALRKPGDDSAVPDVLTLPSVLATNRMFSIGTVLSSSQGPRLPVARRLVLATETWTLLAPIAMQRLSQRIARLAETRFAGAFDSLLVLDTDLHVVASPDLERVGQRIARPDWLTEVDLEALRNNVAFRGQRTTGERGAHIVAIRRLETAPLLFLAQVEEEQVLAPVRAMRTLVIAVSVGAAALACLFGLWWSRRASAPIARLVGLAEDLAAQRFDRPVDIRSGDEFETLGVAFNSAARSLADSERERANAAAIRTDLSRFLPAQLVDRVVRREHTIELGGTRRTVTVMFADVAGFTSLIERYRPEVVIPVLNELFTLLTEIIFRHRGTVDKFVGDCVMALWNAPDDDADHAAAAVRCAQDFLRWVELANVVWQRRVGITIHLAIGIHTGEAAVGNFGSKSRMEYTAMGDTVNVASRLEHLARPQQILVGAATVRAAPAAGTYVALGSTRLAGKADPVEIFEVIAD